VQVTDERGQPVGTARLRTPPQVAAHAGRPVIQPESTPAKGFTNSLGMQFAHVPAGKSWLGGGGNKPGDQDVEFKEDFYLGVYEVTQEEWQKVTGLSPSHFSRSGQGKEAVQDVPDAELKRFPVESVSYDDIQTFLARLNEITAESGWTYRLPREGEWEYACRGGPLSDRSQSAFDAYFDKPVDLLLPEHANFAHAKSPKRTCQVGKFPPNPLGLYDMIGNVWELCDDAVTDDQPAPGRRLRGGFWGDTQEYCRVASVGWAMPKHRANGIGFRLARVRVQPNYYRNSLGMEFVLVPQGKSWLGGGRGQPGDKEVEIPEDFYLGKYEVTQEEWQMLTGSNPSNFKAVNGVAPEHQKRFPVEQVLWDEAQDFIKRVNEKTKETGWVYRLPTVVEWEYACRGGPLSDRNQSAFDFYFERPATTLLPAQANFDFGEHALKRPCQVGSYPPNHLGLCDMHGNVVEWCEDEQLVNSARLRAIRGGCWGYDAESCRAARPNAFGPSSRDHNIGLRLARVRTTAEPLTDAGFVPLFNRDDLSGWTAKRSATIDWRNENGTITGRNRSASLNSAGQLTSQKQYKDFHFRCEVLAGSGVEPVILFRNDDSLVKGARRGYALTDPLPGSPVIAEGWGHGALYADDFQILPHQSRLAPATETDLGIKAGDWYQLEFIARNQTVEVRINGKKTATYSSSAPTLNKAGSISLRCGAGADIAFRNLQIKDLSASEPAVVDQNGYEAFARGSWQPVLNERAKPIELRNAQFRDNRLEIVNGHAYDKSVSAADLIVRAKVQKLKGQQVQLTLRDVLGVYYFGIYQFDNVERFGIGTRDTRFRVSVKQHFEAVADVPEGEFFELAFAAVGDTLTVYCNGKQVGQIRDASITRPGGVAAHATKGKGVFKDVEVMVLDKAP
jgi:formylglycine-generating enzyme required for sulfatase activity